MVLARWPIEAREKAFFVIYIDLSYKKQSFIFC